MKHEGSQSDILHIHLKKRKLALIFKTKPKKESYTFCKFIVLKYLFNLT
ncbi:hypothetical protein BROOK1789B_464 [Bathymodiolus brooksi thiotrophic gill symbiont]|nr:hypothetical protein BROOK1789B_464 [Bathymodiolus brooksi thiotrophic gill symbiont]